MGLFTYIFGIGRTRSAPLPDTVAPCRTTVVSVPRHRDDVEDWVPPQSRHAPPKSHAEALVTLFQAEGRTGSVPHWELTSAYPECAWVHGFYELSERELLKAMGQVCDKVRPMMDRGDGTVGKVVHYVIPAPAWADSDGTASNVVPIGNKKRKRAQMAAQSARSGTRVYGNSHTPKNFAHLPKTGRQGKGGSFRAGISNAVA